MAGKLYSSLSEVVDPGHSALVIIDAQHDFCSERGAMAQRFGFDMKEIREAVPRLNELIRACRERGVPVVWVREIFADRKMHPNQKALWGAGEDIWLIREDGPGIDWYEGMIEPLADEPVITKWQYDAFADTDFHLLLQSRGIETLIMTGFTTNVCVETTARHGYINGYYIVLAEDCAGAPTPAEHESGVFNIKTYFGHVATGEELVGIWDRERAAVTA
jgi:nicotinamidase-related amidase